MFASFFPSPRLFFLSALLWTGVCMAIWYTVGHDLGETLSLGHLIGFGYPPPLADGADEAAQAAFQAAQTRAVDVWLYQYMIVAGAVFAFVWYRLSPHRWFWWSVVVSFVILFIVWFQVQLDVMINEWFGVFYDMIQKALGSPDAVTIADYYTQLLTFTTIECCINFTFQIFKVDGK